MDERVIRRGERVIRRGEWVIRRGGWVIRRGGCAIRRGERYWRQAPSLFENAEWNRGVPAGKAHRGRLIICRVAALKDSYRPAP